MTAAPQPHQAFVHRPDVSAAVRELRSALRLTQQAFAAKLKTPLVTIARWETVQNPRGRTLNLLMALATDAGQPKLAEVFRKELFAELALALRSQFQSAVRHSAKPKAAKPLSGTLLTD